MVSLLEEISWLDQDYSLPQFGDKYRNSLPVVALVKSGYYGAGDQVIGADEIFWIYGFQRQKRVVVKSANGHHLSIPLDYPIKFHLIRNRRKCQAVPLSNIIENLKMQADSNTIMLEDNQMVTYNIDAKTGSSAKFGLLKIIDTYELKYLLAHSMCNAIDPVTMAIPVYMAITFDVANGCAFGDENQFQTWMADVRQITDSFDHTPAKLCNEIIIFHDYEHNGSQQHYEYMRTPLLATPSSNHVYQRLTPIDSDDKSRNSSNSFIDQKQSMTPRKLPLLPKKLKQISCHSVPPIPIRPAMNHRRALPSEPNHASEPDMSPVYERISIVASNSSIESFHEQGTSRRRAPPPVPPDDQLTNNYEEIVAEPGLNVNHFYTPVPPPPPAETLDSDEDDDENYELFCRKSKFSPVVDDKLESKENNLQETGQLSGDSCSNGVALLHPASLLNYEDASVIPTDVNFKSASLDEISHLLQLLSLEKHAGIFVERLIDGQLLECIDEEMLIGDLHFKPHEATMLLSFVREGWRPSLKVIFEADMKAVGEAF